MRFSVVVARAPAVLAFGWTRRRDCFSRRSRGLGLGERVADGWREERALAFFCPARFVDAPPFSLALAVVGPSDDGRPGSAPLIVWDSSAAYGNDGWVVARRVNGAGKPKKGRQARPPPGKGEGKEGWWLC